jgi:hypothetical protein
VLFVLLRGMPVTINTAVMRYYMLLPIMTLQLQHPFTLIVGGPRACGKSTFVIRLLECREQLCNTVFIHIVWRHSENNAPHHLKEVSFVKGVPDFENPEHVPTLVVLDDLMDSAHSS